MKNTKLGRCHFLCTYTRQIYTANAPVVELEWLDITGGISRWMGADERIWPVFLLLLLLRWACQTRRGQDLGCHVQDWLVVLHTLFKLDSLLASSLNIQLRKSIRGTWINSLASIFIDPGDSLHLTVNVLSCGIVGKPGMQHTQQNQYGGLLILCPSWI